jgi:1-acyl-sn-glycerol-3-phosphate acyltransferase
MGDGKLNRAIEQGKARTTEIKTRVPELKERMPEFKERVPEFGSELRARGSELRSRGQDLARQYGKMDVSWARCGYARIAREVLLSGILGPMIDWYVRSRAVGREIFDDPRLERPVIFVANHSSHLDTPVVLRAIPRKWRNRTAVAAAADYFYKKRWKANGVALMFNTVPLGRDGGGIDALEHVEKLIGQGWNLMMFPEGTRSRKGDIGKIRSGAAVIAARTGIDIVPIYVAGTHEVMPPGRNWPKRKPGKLFSRRHKVEVRFGEPIASPDESLRKETMQQVRDFWDREGLPLEPKVPAMHDVLIIHNVLQAHEAALAAREPSHRFSPQLDTVPDTVNGRSASAG